MGKVTVEIEDMYDEGTIKDRVIASLTELTRRSLAQTLETTMKEQLQELVAEVSRQKVEALIDKTLAEGWKTTNRYGEEDGKVETIKERIAAVLEKKEKARYDAPEKGIVDRIIEQTVASHLDKEFKVVVEEAKERFKESVDKVVTVKLTETLKSALGLR